MTHFIRQQFLNVELKGSESDGFALQRHLSEMYYSKVLPAIEEVLDLCSTSGERLVIDRLEIDTGTIELDRIDLDLAPAVAKALKRSIEKEAAKAGLAQGNQEQEVAYSQNNQENIWEVFIYFLLKGILPWAYNLPAGKSLEVVLSELLINHEAGTETPVPALKIMEVFKYDTAAKRLTVQFSERFTQMLLQKVSPEVIKVYNELDSFLSSPDHLINLTDHFSFTPENLKILRMLVLEKCLIHATSDHKIQKVEIIKQVLIELESKTDLVKLVSKVFNPILSSPSTMQSEQNVKDIQTAKEFIPTKESQALKRITGGITNVETREGIFIDNAGLVLLHPFLARFFEELGIAREEELLQPERAVCLLHYLITGQTGSPEYELVLPKILCGIPLSTPVRAEMDISESELKEASLLLDAVIKHWEALRNTTQDGLRGTFLVRQGKLSQKGDGDWLLQVESRTFDVLLDQLPWGISMIKLPWMKKMLWVEWRL